MDSQPLAQRRGPGLTARLAIAVVVLLAVSVAISLALVSTVGDLRDAQDAALHSQDVVTQAQNAQKLVLDLETGARGFVITGDPTFLQPWTKARGSLPGVLTRLTTLVADNPAQEARARAIRAAALDYLRKRSIPFVSRARSNRAAAARLVAGGGGKRRVDGLRRQFNRFEAVERRLLVQRAAHAHDEANTARDLVLAGFFVLALVTAVIVLVFSRGVMRPLERLARAARRIGQGDLSARVRGDAPAEAGELVERFNAMAAALEQNQRELSRLSETNVATLDAFFTGAPLGLGVWDEQLRFVRVNEAMAQINGVPAAEHEGRPIPEVLPQLAPRLAPDLRQVLDSGVSMVDVEVSGETPSRPGETRYWRASYYPIRTREGDVRGVAAVVADVTAEHEAQRRTGALYDLSAALGATARTDEVERVAIEQAVRAFDLDGAELRPRPRGDGAVELPLQVSGRDLGVLALHTDDGREWTDEDRELMRTFAGFCAQAFERVRLYEREHEIAFTLQQSLLPDHLPEIPGIALSVLYRAAGEQTDVGGDFYDAFAVGPDSWIVIVGDVCGKGPEAAAVTALARYTLRAQAVHEHDPSALLLLLNDALRDQRDDLRFVTAACARLDRTGDGFHVTVAGGGHPLPVFSNGRGAATPVGYEGTALGIVEDPELRDHEFELTSGSRLLLYTDGLLEARAPAQLLGSRDLAALCNACAGRSGDDYIACVQRGAGADGNEELRDDLAMLLVEALPLGRSTA